jgi:hypothetical protein
MRRRRAHAQPVEKDVDKLRMNCAKVAISSTEKFKIDAFYCSKNADSLPVFAPARESTGERQDACKASLKAPARAPIRKGRRQVKQTSDPPGRQVLLRASRPSEARSPVRSKRLSRKMRRSGEGLVRSRATPGPGRLGDPARGADRPVPSSGTGCRSGWSDGGRHGSASCGAAAEPVGNGWRCGVRAGSTRARDRKVPPPRSLVAPCGEWRRRRPRRHVRAVVGRGAAGLRPFAPRRQAVSRPDT